MHFFVNENEFQSVRFKWGSTNDKIVLIGDLKAILFFQSRLLDVVTTDSGAVILKF